MSDKTKKHKDKKKSIRETVEAVVIALLLALVIRTFVIQAFKIPSGSMEDTLLVGDHIIVSKLSYGIQVPRPALVRVFGLPVPFIDTTLYDAWGGIKTGDVIVFRFPNDREKDYIKRVVGAPGDVVEMRDKAVYINGVKWDDPASVYKGGLPGGNGERRDFAPFTVPKGEVFVMGDNRDRSFDSRFWGTVPMSDVRGRALFIYWSWDGNGSWVRFSRIGRIID